VGTATSVKKVLVIDDSALVRQLLTEILNADPGLEVVGSAADPYIARDKIKALQPDVLTLDVEMPRMDGITFLRNLMRLRPMPVVMVSSLTQRGAEVTLEALDLGAVDFVSKPRLDVRAGLESYAEEIRQKVRTAARVPVARLESRLNAVPPKHSADAVLDKRPPRFLRTTDRLVAVGASTGGTQAIRLVLSRLPADAPGIVVTQHIPGTFSESFAKRLDGATPLCVCQADDGQQILPGHVYIAPGDRHLLVERSGARYLCRLHDGPPVNRHKPSVDVLFRSVAQNVGPNAIGVLLTGMGDDGARGLLEMREAGAQTLVQDEHSSVVWGMPGEAVRLGAAGAVLPLERIAAAVLDAAGGGRQDKSVAV